MFKKAVVIGDIHLSKYGQDELHSESMLPMRLHSLNETMKNIFQYCYDNNIEYIIILGDCLHNKSVIYSLAQSIMLNWFRNNKNLKFIVIDGNHDLSGKGSNVVSALESIDSEENVNRIKDDYFRMNDILFVPYSHNMIEIIKNHNSKYLCSHFGLNEAMLDSGISIVADLSISDLQDKYETVLLGHYHLPQDIHRDNFRLYYTGSIIQLDWGEKNQEKRFLDVNFQTGEIKSIPTSGYISYNAFEIDDTKTKEEINEIIQKVSVLNESGHHVNIINKSKKVDLSQFKNTHIIDKTETDITNRGIKKSMSEIDKFKKYLEINEISEPQSEKYISVAKELIEEIGEKI
jgi:DNA repair exonuclease SbcCD nuclease subunit